MYPSTRGRRYRFHEKNFKSGTTFFMPASALSESFYNPTEEHKMLRQTVRQLAREVVEPQAMEHDQSGTFNTGLLRKLGELGLIGITIPEADGGAGLDAVASVIAHEELSRSDPGFTLGYLAHALLFVNNFYYASSEEQRKRWLPDVLSGARIGGMGMTEPSGGTDVLGMGTVARRDGDGFVLTGRKMFITNANEGDIF